MAIERRNLSDKEIIQTDSPELDTLGVGGQGDGAGGITDGGSVNEGGIGVPANFVIIEQTVRTDQNGEYIVDVVVEFDAVPGASEYRSYIRGGVN